MMDRLFQHSGWLKLFSLGLAIILWAMVMPQYNRQEFRLFEVPLTVVQHPDYVMIEGPPPQATVQVRAEGKNLAMTRLKKEQISASVDFRKVTEAGKPVQLEVRVEGPNRPQISYSVSPSTWMVTLVENSEAPVDVDVEPKTGERFFNGKEYRFRARPVEPRVTVTGRSDYLKLVRLGRIVLDENDLVPTNTEVTKGVMPIDAMGKPVDKLPSPTAKVELVWEELPPGKPFKVEPVTRGTLPNGFVVTGLTVEPASVKVRAETLTGVLPAREILETVPIDLTDRRQSFTTTVRVISPPGTTASMETVNVTVRIAETSVEKVFKGVPVTVTGRATNADVSLSQTDVQVRIKGPYSLITPLDASVLKVYVDVEGASDGRHLLPVKHNWPVGATEVDVDPAYVEVTISIR